ncbi:uncharacterized protein PFL1_06189 [Pseudozyma flocculosa PF-1]|uniref:non-specific serine/threonine protein kinase n=1 Tax=Pseudozyma flocculosa PF-1 TaxID=1277687 RepID=A0A061H244_9BASI|nr:uncharacterized protein PFL1_06189 [Pseudozyma flocculosa PF-1]EPQ26254.1 hypothetical protein PFL1_06189 [Pseudozyma flocculosa PF-1]
MWWQRGAPSSEDEGDATDPPPPADPGPASQSPLGASSVETVNASGLGLKAHSSTEQDGERSTAAPAAAALPSRQPTGPTLATSPAADFLSNFSSLHSVASPSSSAGAGSLLGGITPQPGQNAQSPEPYGKALVASPTDLGRSRSSGGGNGLWSGLGDAAAKLYDGGSVGTAGGESATITPRPDEQGARFGPGGRYVMGRTIGFGGFSTVREGFDIEGLSRDEAKEARRIAVKIVYQTQESDEVVHGAAKRHSQWSHELDIWRSLPAHPHLLPLLHSEVVSLPRGGGSHMSGAASSAELLVMPLCDRGNLLDYVRSEGGTRGPSLILGSADSGRGTPKASSLSRSASLNTPFGNANAETGKSVDSSRTGSGFLSRGHRRLGLGRVPSASGVPASNLPWSLNASQLQLSTASNTSSPSSVVGSLSSGSGLLRRASSQMARSRGVPIDVARETMRQLASALRTLHTQAGVLHSDLKLENILGQNLRTSRSDGSIRTTAGAAGPPVSSSSSSFSSDDGGELEEQLPCWRLADFGLARRIVSNSTDDGAFSRLHHHGQTLGQPQQPAQSRGGSLAYTAPEYLRAKSSTPSGVTTPGGLEADAAAQQASTSPFAADMWALGCILYALLSGRLPFADSFEPRLQMKIAKAQWDIPTRLRRRAERLADASRGGLRHAREASGGSQIGADPGGAIGERPLSTLIEGRHVGPFGRLRAADVDLSASLPSLPSRERPTRRLMSAFEPPMASFAETGRTSDHVVGSAPGRADHVDRIEINPSAKALADAEVDPESDEDDGVEAEWDGLSWDRAAAREVLHGLLEPDPSKRWTIERLCASAWIRGDNDDSVGGIRTTAGEADNIHPVADTHTKRTGLAGQSISERPSQETLDASLDFRRRSSSQSRDRGTLDLDVASTLARSRPADLSAESSGPVSPALPTSRSGFDDSHSSISSRPMSRDSFRDRSESRTRSTGFSESSTPSRGEGGVWHAAHHALDVAHWPSISRCDSPADSERRGRQSRSRMADLDENQTWSADKDQSAAERYNEWRTGRVAMPVPIPARSQSHSRSRSRHSRESGSPDRLSRRSHSKPRPLLPGSYDASGSGAGFLRGRSFETRSGAAAVGGSAFADQTQAHRSSTSRSRSRAPDALAQILGRDRATSRSRGTPTDDGERSLRATAGSSSSSLSLAANGGPPGAPAARAHEPRGRARDRK